MNVSPSLPPVLNAKANGVLTVTLNRPETRNALSESMMKALQLTLDEAVEDKDVKVIVLAAKGSVFSAGHRSEGIDRPPQRSRPRALPITGRSSRNAAT